MMTDKLETNLSVDRITCLLLRRFSQTCLKKLLKGPQKWDLLRGLSTQVNYSEICTLEGLKGQSLTIGDL